MLRGRTTPILSVLRISVTNTILAFMVEISATYEAVPVPFPEADSLFPLERMGLDRRPELHSCRYVLKF